jgi:hypothetical protein
VEVVVFATVVVEAEFVKLDDEELEVVEEDFDLVLLAE